MPPSDPAAATPACTCGRLRRAARALTQVYDDALAPVRLRVGQFSLLRTLARNGPTRISDLARAALVDRTALSRTLDPLVERGLVEIVPGRDSRTRVVSVTRAGARALTSAQPHWNRAQHAVSRRLGAAQTRTLIELLRQVEALHPDPGGLDR